MRENKVNTSPPIRRIKTMAKKIKVCYLKEGIGLYTKGTKIKEEAVKAMYEDALHEFNIDKLDWYDTYSFLPEDITNESVIETWYFQCRKCDMETIGDDNLCYECGEPCGTNGRKTFEFIN